ncbi:MAG: MFS transporter [Beijerinckiaceae bacterium]|nr:MFS transporter [Beijerinckiaceae bacterium]
MTAIAQEATSHSGDQQARRNALLLAAATGVAGANATVVFATGALVGRSLATRPEFATLPISFFVVGAALATYPANMLMRSLGRRAVFMQGNVCGALAGFTGAAAVYVSSFWLFCLGTLLAGVYHAVITTYRFAAADTATPAFRPKAISWVLTGGVIAAVIGPQLVNFTKELTMPYLFMGTFVAQATMALLAMLFTSRFHDARPSSAAVVAGRPLAEIAKAPRFIVAVICGTAAQTLMNMVMTAAPLAMAICGHSLTSSTNGIMFHVLAMYAPSFFTGGLIARFGKEVMVVAGLSILVACAAVHLSGISVTHFWAGLILLGLGWNFAFISATSIVTDCHTPAERNAVQGLNDTLIFATTAVGSFLSGYLLDRYGWDSINLLILPVAAFSAIAVLGLRASRHRAIG